MQNSVSTSGQNTVIAAALARPLRRRPVPRGGRGHGISGNNYLAELSAEARRAKAQATPEGGGGYDFSGNNYVAEGKKPGAKSGNCNARKHGRYSAKSLETKRALRRYLKSIDAFCVEIGRMCQARSARTEVDRFITANMPLSPRGALMEWVADDEPRAPLSV